MKRSERLGLASLRAQERAEGRRELARRVADARAREAAERAAGEAGGEVAGSYLPRQPQQTPQEGRERLRRGAPAFVALSHRAFRAAEPPRRDGSIPIEIEAAIAKAPRTPGLHFKAQDGARYQVARDGSVRRIVKKPSGNTAKRARQLARLARRSEERVSRGGGPHSPGGTASPAGSQGAAPPVLATDHGRERSHG